MSSLFPRHLSAVAVLTALAATLPGEERDTVARDLHRRDTLRSGSLACLRMKREQPREWLSVDFGVWFYWDLSPDGKWVVTSEKGKTHLWDLATGKETRVDERPGTPFGGRLLFSPDSKTFLLVAPTAPPWEGWENGVGLGGSPIEPALLLCETATGKALWRTETKFRYLEDVAFAADGKLLFARVRTDWPPRDLGEGVVVTWDTATGKEVRRLPAVTGLACAADGRLLAGADREGLVHVWDAASGREVRTLKDNRAGNVSIALSADGKRLACGYSRPADPDPLAKPPPDRTVRVWDTATGEEVARCEGHQARVGVVRFSADGRLLLSGEFDRLFIRDAATGKLLRRVAVSGWDWELGPDGKTLAFVDKPYKVGLLDLATDQRRSWAAPHERWASFRFTPDAKTLLSYGDRALCVWDVAAGKPRLPLGGQDGEMNRMDED
jgi:WD40 repeat protein